MDFALVRRPTLAQLSALERMPPATLPSLRHQFFSSRHLRVGLIIDHPGPPGSCRVQLSRIAINSLNDCCERPWSEPTSKTGDGVALQPHANSFRKKICQFIETNRRELCGSVESLGEAGLGRGDGVVDATAVAVAGDGAVRVPALAARLSSAADAEALAAVVVGQAGEDLLGGELRDLVCARQQRRRNQMRTQFHLLWDCGIQSREAGQLRARGYKREEMD
jgi:hypothetical protein